jgi:hypothetical protein
MEEEEEEEEEDDDDDEWNDMDDGATATSKYIFTIDIKIELPPSQKSYDALNHRHIN